ncbi:helix-turn-helix transcriptional regulator [Sedimentitalea arenosa]|uniref:helix-turn-helix transcriptional regulator n=1 Tax=Sedimentitalea arenosa TaxID=2798803 RepID=UPI001D0BBDB6|nr:helix-turn-helix domain-containing protein [Arenibacterium arenosum]
MKDLRKMLGGRGRTTIYRDIAAGRLPTPTNIGGINYFPEDLVQAALQQLRSDTELAD